MKTLTQRLRSPEFADVAEKYLMEEAAQEIERLQIVTAGTISAIRQVIGSLEHLGEDGWSGAPYLLRECRRALQPPTTIGLTYNQTGGEQ